MFRNAYPSWFEGSVGNFLMATLNFIISSVPPDRPRAIFFSRPADELRGRPDFFFLRAKVCPCPALARQFCGRPAQSSAGCIRNGCTLQKKMLRISTRIDGNAARVFLINRAPFFLWGYADVCE